MRVLIVEDDRRLCDVLREFLLDLGHEPVITHDGESALDLLRSERPDVVLLDIGLPGMSGLDFLRLQAVRELRVPILVVSGRVTETEVQECLRLGAFDFLGKPFAFERLAQILACFGPPTAARRVGASPPTPRPGSAPRPLYGEGDDDVFPSPSRRQPAETKRARRRRRSVSVLFTVLVLVGSITVLVALATTWAVRRNPVVPTDLVGVWRTADPRYAARFLEITRTSIFFAVEDGVVGGHPIVAVDGSAGAGTISYTISYRDQHGQRRRVAIDYDSRKAGVIRLKHQPQIEWTREPSQ